MLSLEMVVADRGEQVLENATFLMHTESTPLEEEVETRDLRGQLDQALGQLTMREAEVLRLRFYRQMTRTAVAALYALSEKRIRQIEEQALAKMRDCLSTDNDVEHPANFARAA